MVPTKTAVIPAQLIMRAARIVTNPASGLMHQCVSLAPACSVSKQILRRFKLTVGNYDSVPAACRTLC